ncbi:MAG: arsenite S-adenosylmethyltransferase, partial [Chitinophagaceae bacterium]|nr:arsenite S-adenosylmethyltransferase [Chitinophagaceae bacterium]
MQTENELKELVKEKYSSIAEQSATQNATSCCGATSSCCGSEVYNIMADDYTQLQGYNADADLGLGCGLPTEFA